MKNKKLEAYTKALLAEAVFQLKHKKLFGELQSLQFQISETATELKKEVKLNIKGNLANEFVKVTFSPAFRKFYDFDIIMAQTTPKQKRELEEAKAIVRSLDKKVFEDLVEKGLIPVEIKQAAFKEIELAPRVTIKEQKPE